MMNQVVIAIVTYAEFLVPIKAIRTTVFQKEQGIAAELEFDGLDSIAIHLLAYIDANPVGTARMRDIGKQTLKLERLAVLPEARRKGIGKQLTQKALDFAQENNYQAVSLNSQLYVKNLYEKLGFQSVGDIFDEAGIPHIKMIKQLP
ncbi:putative acyltransferase [Xenococcus sp. PCC 7305]|uniref:GNAT family N-acetyltransferase n=1 Tax=Xenococcus sp. PCC 7305 TaxID=102125 RepID=UPI0002AC3067|nr:GNAT family N-acetyltransferase [Xenococcus sp. PCC 7305]ELS03742.1 putative acyltransferase [Xenococcus sp. PCC 7305]